MYENNQQVFPILTFTPITVDHIRQFVFWQYEPPYDVYNEDPAQMEAIVDYYLDPQFQCRAMLDKMGEMVGLCSFGADGQVPGGDYSREALDIGLAIRPDLTGQGRGSGFIEAVLDFGRRQYYPPAFRVTIAEFNERAQRVWQKAGFNEVQRFGRESDGLPFIIFVLPANLS
jgi:RimJ/RimL family protein N-acetyltransferase